MIEKDPYRSVWKCAICGKIFRTLEDIRIHMAQEHVLGFVEGLKKANEVKIPKEFNPSER